MLLMENRNSPTYTICRADYNLLHSALHINRLTFVCFDQRSTEPYILRPCVIQSSYSLGSKEPLMLRCRTELKIQIGQLLSFALYSGDHDVIWCRSAEEQLFRVLPRNKKASLFLVNFPLRITGKENKLTVI